MTPAPDYGEPWTTEVHDDGEDADGLIVTGVSIDRRTGESVFTVDMYEYKAFDPALAKRAVACVNAMKGIADPESFVRAADAFDSICVCWAGCYSRHGGECDCGLTATKDAYRASRGTPSKEAPPAYPPAGRRGVTGPSSETEPT